MSSACAVCPSSFVDKKDGGNGASHADQHTQPSGSNYFSPNSPGYIPSTSASRVVNDANTPAESISVLSENYQSSDYSDIGDDPFCHIDFGAVEHASPSFLLAADPLVFDDHHSLFNPPDQSDDVARAGSYQLISPDHTPSGDPATLENGHQGLRSTYADPFPTSSVSPQELSKPFNKPAVPLDSGVHSACTLTPSASDSRRSSDGNAVVELGPVMSGNGPYVTVSVWGNDNGGFPVAEGSPSHGSDPLDGASHVAASSPVRDAEGRWIREDAATGTGGLDPEHRPQGEAGASINEAATEREVDQKNKKVCQWLAESIDQDHSAREQAEDPTRQLIDQDDNISPTEIPLGDKTENRPLPGQTYFLEGGGEITADDIEIMRQNRNFADAPLLQKIHQTDPEHAHQPLTSQAAIEKFQRMCWDNDALSRAATWGTRRTRRRSFPLHDPDYEETLSGNFLKKLSLGRGDGNHRPGIFSRAVQGLKRQSSSSKRHRSSIPEDGAQLVESPGASESLAPRPGALGGALGGAGKKQSVPSINTAFVSVGASVAAVGSTAHVRSRSITAAPTVGASKSPTTSTLSLGVKNMLRRPRSGSELTNMWKKTGGPPVARLAKTTSTPAIQAPATVAAAEPDDDEDDDEEMYEDIKEESEATEYVDDAAIKPTLDGFKEHILRLNPMLRTENRWLAERIAYHQVARYKRLLDARIGHLKTVTNGQCCVPPRPCITQGGSAGASDATGRGPLSATGYREGSGADLAPLEGAIGQESFPQGIPMPPTRLLPAEFECPLCFRVKKFSKPSDWTKHVHEDVQPFTCTWDRCHEAKPFKRKADWVRHENEGHRHLEWWACSVEDCTHTCYRRDNFLQHLVREHKLAEPKNKTKAAIKRAAGPDPTWDKVESCHVATSRNPQDEPCRFCGKTFPTWKKLTVHLAKHMEQISLPVLRLVERAAVQADTIISPIQDPPPRAFPATPAFHNIKMEQEHASYNIHPSNAGMVGAVHHPLTYANTQQQQQQGFYPAVPTHTPTSSHLAQAPHFRPPQAFYNNHVQQQYNNIAQTLDTRLNMPVNNGYNTTQGGYPSLPASTGTYMVPGTGTPYLSMAPDTEPFPALVVANPLGLQGMQDPSGAAYADIMDQCSAGGGDTYTPHGSHGSSPYLHSPGQGQRQYYQ